MEYRCKIEANDPAKAGQLAGKKVMFGACSRYATAPVHTRHDALTWFVWDAEGVTARQLMKGEQPPVVRQEPTFAKAIDGLNLEHEAGNWIGR